MRKKILITDSLFMYDQHVAKLEAAGYEVVRLDKPDASEQELIEAIKDKAGYILGGVEYVTDKVIDAADQLEVLLFTGTGYKGHIPGWRKASERGIKLANTPYANIFEVSEWGVAATLAMQRNLFGLGPRGKQRFVTEDSITDKTVGVVGLGHIGKKYADMMFGLGAKEIIYNSQSDKDVEYAYKDKEALLAEADVIFIAVADDAGSDYIVARDLQLMKKDALLVSIAHHGIINENDLYDAVESGHIRAAIDIVHDLEKFKGLPADRWYASNGSSAFNTWSFLNRASDMATETMINLLDSGKDQYLIDPK